MDSPNTDLPEWLQTPQLPTPDDPRLPLSSTARATLVNHTYPNLFEHALERLMGGVPMAAIVANDNRGITLGRFMQWALADPTRKRRYEQACEVAAETMAVELNSIADGLPLDATADNATAPSAYPVIPEETQRTALRLKSRMYLMEKWSRSRYGDSKHIQIDSTSVSATMKAEDLARMSLADLKRMAYEHVVRSAPTPRGDEIDVTPTPITPVEDESAAA
jgi:hypothetical protein